MGLFTISWYFIKSRLNCTSYTAIASLCWNQKKVPSISLITIALWTFVEAKFSKIEIKHDALFEGRWYTGKNICQIGPNRLCILTAIFIRASCFISILVIWASTKVHKVIFTSESLGTFFWCQHILAKVVWCILIFWAKNWWFIELNLMLNSGMVWNRQILTPLVPKCNYLPPHLNTNNNNLANVILIINLLRSGNKIEE